MQIKQSYYKRQLIEIQFITQQQQKNRTSKNVQTQLYY